MGDYVVPSEYTRSGNTTHLKEVHPIADDEQFSYGTAGFRFKAEKLPFIVYRCAYMAGLRARHLNCAIGMMITASHNPGDDNGVKLVDPSGEMLNISWEKYLTEVVNATDAEFADTVREFERQIVVKETCKSRVICGIDTRVSGPHLKDAACAGAALFKVPFEFYGVVTTPMLHYAIKCHNEPEFAPATHEGYYSSIANAFKELYELTEEPEGSKYEKLIHLDCANGVGGARFKELLKQIPEDMLKIEFLNSGLTAEEVDNLNQNCGADFVKIQQKLPISFSATEELKKCASFDGDADRLIYFRPKPNGDDGRAELCDGDKMAVLIATYVQEQLKVYESLKPREHLTMGIVQTAYANGSSTRYIRETLGVKTVIVPTGVKHLHEAALEFDIGIYFEANGHGTVVFSEIFDKIIRKEPDGSVLALRRLALFSRIINEAVGDALADLLAVEIILRHKGWSMQNWLDELYQDVPNVQIKVPVEDRSIFKTTNAEQTLVKPEGIQQLIDEDVAKYKNARAFIRPSGTENIVRVYAEADTMENTLELGKSLEKVVLGLRNTSG